jgi:hypothetical protein
MPSYPDVPLVTYAWARAHLWDGDLLLCSGSSAMSQMIQRATASVFSHVAFVRWDHGIDRVMVLESVESIGVHTTPLSQYVRNYQHSGRPYPGRLWIARHTALSASAVDLAAMYQWAYDRLNTPYDTQEILRIALRITSAKLGMPAPPYLPDHLYICSEFLWQFLAQGGITMACDARGFFAPADVARDQDVRILWEVATETHAS